jgi:ABC-type Mn2+/Zn2+ transport system permease subunit
MSADTLLLSAAAAVASGLIGCFAVMRRMALAADALSHVALPGIGIALALHIHPLFGAATMLFVGALLVWAVEERSRMDTETVVGVVFAAALAIGSMLTSTDELLEALFGRVTRLSWLEAVVGVAASAAVAAFVVRHKNNLIVALVSPDIARTAGIDVRRLNLLYLQAFALTIALGLRYLGVLLMGSLIIIPAATAKRLSNSLTQMLLISTAIAVTVTVLGAVTASWLERESGPAIVSFAAGLFFCTLLYRRPS